MTEEGPGDGKGDGAPHPLEEDQPVPAGLTLENVIDLTGEFEHLNELVVLHLEKNGCAMTPEVYFRTVHPILDLLEVEIRIRSGCSISRRDLKLLIQDWIDQEIADLKRA